MEVSELLRGLGGALIGLLATLLLLLCFVETREHLGKTERGVAWMSLRSHVPKFDPLWKPLAYYGLFGIVTGYIMGVRLTSQRAARYLLYGAAGGIVLLLLLPTPLPEKYGRAGQNTVRILTLFGGFLGGACGVLYAERSSRKRFVLDDES